MFADVTVPGLVIILAPNHTGIAEAEGGVSLWEAGAFRTPLGDVPIDAQIAEALLDVSRGVVGVDHDAHRAEHAVEVELPFLQLLRADVRIVPLVLAWDAWDAARLLGEMLARLVSPSRKMPRRSTRYARWTVPSCSRAAGAIGSRCVGAGRQPPSSPPRARWAQSERRW